MQRASSDQSTVSSSTQHDSDAGSGMSPISACGDDFLTEEHMEGDFEEADHAQDPAHTQYSAGPFHYTRHQVCCRDLWVVRFGLLQSPRKTLVHLLFAPGV